jgi:hypothetical protein
MGILWRLLAPKPLKKARRSVRKVAHPVRTASWALSPKAVKQLRRGAFRVAHPLEAAEFAAENVIVNAARDRKRGRRTPSPGTARVGRASASAPVAPAGLQRVRVTWLPGSYEIPVARLEHHAMAVRDTIAAVAHGAEPDAGLQPEPANPHDPNAIAVCMAGGHVGYVPRRIAAVLQPALISHSRPITDSSTAARRGSSPGTVARRSCS